MIPQEAFRQAQEFVKDCKDKTVHIFHDSDADGIGAGFQLFHAVQAVGGVASISTHTDRSEILSEEAYRAAKGVDRVIIADINPKSNGNYDVFRKHFPSTQLLILDHHHVEEYADAVFVHAGELHNVEGADYCTAKLAYDLTKPVLGDQFIWLAASGVLGDKNENYFPEVLTTALRQEGFSTQESIYSSPIGVINEAIQCSQAIDNDSLQNYLSSLRECNTLREAASLANPHPEVREAFEELVAEADKQASTDSVVWVFLNSPYGISGWISNAVSDKHPDTVLVVYRDKGDAFTMSLRLQSRAFHLGEVVNEVASLVGGSGGGHRPAAGARIPKERFEEFQELFTAQAKKLLS
ncbi:MAG: DHH family phosphoesterase [Candidatus Woesearchaeota archaeon]